MNKVQLARAVSLTSYFSLIALIMLWITWLGNLNEQVISMYLVMFCTPLLLPMRGILRGDEKAHVWGTLVVLLYAVHGGMTWYSVNDNHLLGATETLLSLTYLFSGSYFLKWRAEARVAAEAEALANGEASE